MDASTSCLALRFILHTCMGHFLGARGWLGTEAEQVARQDAHSLGGICTF